MRCEVCGHDNLDRYVFCEECGNRLRSAAAPSPEGPAAPPPQAPPLQAPQPQAPQPQAPQQPTPYGAYGAYPAPAGYGYPQAGYAPAPQPIPVAPVAPPSPVAYSPPPPPPAAAQRPSANAIDFEYVLRGAVPAQAGVGATIPIAVQPQPPSHVACSACGARNRVGDRFCVDCGTPLGGSAAPVAPAAPPPPPEPPALAAAPPPAPSESGRTPHPLAVRRVVNSEALPLEPGAQGFTPVAEGVVPTAPVFPVASSRPPSPSTVVCRRCQGVLPAGTRFCKFCGEALDPSAERGVRVDAPPAPVPPAPKHPLVATEPNLPAFDQLGPPIAEPPLRKVTPVSEEEPPAPPPPEPPRFVPVAPTAPPEEETPPPPESEVQPESLAAAGPTAPSAESRDTDASVDPPSGIVDESTVEAANVVNALAQAFAQEEAVEDVARARLVTPRRSRPPQPSAEIPADALGRVAVLLEDGSEGPSYAILGDQTDIGRSEGEIQLERDRFVSERHARILRSGAAWILRDLASVNGVYHRIRKPYPLRDGDLLLLGLQVLQFRVVSEAERGLGQAEERGTHIFGSAAPNPWARLSQRTVEGVTRDVYHLVPEEVVLGRESGDIVFTRDPFLSRRHASIRRDPAGGAHRHALLSDLDSSNGVYVRIRGDVPLHSGDHFRVGQHLLRIYFH